MDDCRLFALAYATALCSGQNPKCLLFKHSVMRAHLLKCLEEEDTKPFPCKTVNRTQQKNKTGNLQVLNTGRREDGILHWMWGMVPQRMRAHTETSLEKKIKV